MKYLQKAYNYIKVLKLISKSPVRAIFFTYLHVMNCIMKYAWYVLIVIIIEQNVPI